MPGYGFDNTLMDRARNAAYESFRGKIMNQADLSVIFAESAQAYAMIERSASTIYRSMKAVARGRFNQAATILKLHVKPIGVTRKKAWADNWMEYSYGWSPFMNDAYKAMEVLNDPVKTFGMAHGRGYEFAYGRDSSNLGSVTKTELWSRSYKAEQGGKILAITDRGLYKLNQWGLLNPAPMVWEIIPFSFVIDWFANVGDFLQSLSDFAGMSLMNVYLTTSFRSSVVGTVNLNPGSSPVPGWSNLQYRGYGVAVSRSLGLWKPVLSMRSLRLPSSARAANAVSLVVQQRSAKNDYGWVPFYEDHPPTDHWARKRYFGGRH
jgi:hypothetical protein